MGNSLDIEVNSAAVLSSASFECGRVCDSETSRAVKRGRECCSIPGRETQPFKAAVRKFCGCACTDLDEKESVVVPDAGAAVMEVRVREPAERMMSGESASCAEGRENVMRVNATLVSVPLIEKSEPLTEMTFFVTSTLPSAVYAETLYSFCCCSDVNEIPLDSAVCVPVSSTN